MEPSGDVVFVQRDEDGGEPWVSWPEGREMRLVVHFSAYDHDPIVAFGLILGEIERRGFRWALRPRREAEWVGGIESRRPFHWRFERAKE
jgi:hypothetical protein